MIEFITHYWLEVVFSALLAGFGIAYRTLSKKVKEQDAIKHGIVALLRDRIIQTYNHYMDKGYCPIYALDNIHSLYEQYQNLGGNGTVTRLMEEIEKIPTERREEKP